MRRLNRQPTVKRALVALLACVSMLGAVLAAPSSAGPPEDFELDDYFILFPDTNVNRSVFINITAEDFCAWDGESPPPVVDDAVPATLNVTGSGDAVGSIDTDLYIELWEFDENPSPLIGPCEDIQEQLEAGTGPWATGVARWKAKTNNLFESEPRSNTFGDRTTAVVTDQEGDTWTYRNVFRLNFSCNFPENAPPTCLVDNSTLRRR